MNKLPRFVLAIVGILLIVLALARALHSWSNHSHVFGDAALGTAILKNLNNTRIADKFTGADTGQKITAALSNIGSNPGQILVTQSGTISSGVTLTSGHELVCAGSEVVLAMSTVASTITQQSNTRIRNCKFSSSLTAGPTAGGTGDSSRLCYQDLPRDPCGGVKV